VAIVWVIATLLGLLTACGMSILWRIRTTR
jgi:hypothetical protein